MSIFNNGKYMTYYYAFMMLFSSFFNGAFVGVAKISSKDV